MGLIVSNRARTNIKMKYAVNHAHLRHRQSLARQKRRERAASVFQVHSLSYIRDAL